MSRVGWERVCDYTERLAVPGGWLYLYKATLGISIVFVPDPHVAPVPP